MENTSQLQLNPQSTCCRSVSQSVSYQHLIFTFCCSHTDFWETFSPFVISFSFVVCFQHLKIIITIVSKQDNVLNSVCSWNHQLQQIQYWNWVHFQQFLCLILMKCCESPIWFWGGSFGAHIQSHLEWWTYHPQRPNLHWSHFQEILVFLLIVDIHFDFWECIHFQSQAEIILVTEIDIVVVTKQQVAQEDVVRM